MRAEIDSAPAMTPVAYPARLLLPSYVATLFLSAGLVFFVQPMVAKMVLPHLGGSPGVWNTCVCFFQAMLLLGYVYAHVLATRFSGVAPALIHGAVVALAAMFLPLDLGRDVPPAVDNPTLWLIGRLAVTVGPPFFAISATAPLLQRWFSRTDHPAGNDPYFLYAASNAGSLLALLAYPLIVEPQLLLWQQTRGWSLGLGLLAVGMIACWLGYHTRMTAEPAASEAGPRPTTADRLRWIAYSFVPSSLLLAVTAYITTDLASAPLFWVVPLALYLVTFILVFARRARLRHSLMVRLQPLVLIPIVILPSGLHSPWIFLLHLACFFISAMVCHGELARSRPQVRDLTEFYLWVSLGGVLGGMFAALLAPVLFPDIWEYPLTLVAACLIRPVAKTAGRGGWPADVGLPTLLLIGMLALVFGGDLPGWVTFGGVLSAALVLLYCSDRRWRFALGVAACLLVLQIAATKGSLASERSFFGVNRVRLIAEGAVRILQHGTTAHGVESLRPGDETTPLGYYSREGPFGRFFAAIVDRSVSRVGVVGLGIGSLGCYARPGETWTFHEIDPAVEKLARRWFHLLGRCGNNPRVVLGDARLTLQDVPDRTYDVLVIDAFSSDSIPLHLLTREALLLYQRKVVPDGIVLFHISNRHLDIGPVIAALARDAGAPARGALYLPSPASIEHSGAQVVALGQSGHDLDFLTEAAGWLPTCPPPAAAALWTDERSDIISRIKWR